MSEITKETEVVQEDMPVKQKSRKGLKWLAVLLVLALIGGVGFEGIQRWRIEKVIACAEEKLGLPYRLGALGPYDYDCSSLVQTCFTVSGVNTPRLAVEIGYSEEWQKVESIDALVRGDIVCWDTISDNDACDHVGIYLGRGEVLHASSSQGKVMVSGMEGYFTDKFSWGLRPIVHLPVDAPFDLSFLASKTTQENVQ